MDAAPLSAAPLSAAPLSAAVFDDVVLDAPFTDQRPGTSGLRKRVAVFRLPHYTEVFIASILHALPDAPPAGHVLVVGGDGRYFVRETVQTIVRMVCACAETKRISRLVVGAGGILSTPAASHLIRVRRAVGGILLTASHNPGGPDKDFGIKFNVESGGPARECVTDAIYAHSCALTAYRIARLPDIDIDRVGAVHQCGPHLAVEIIDPVDDYVALMKEIFDFQAIRNFRCERPGFSFMFDAMHGVTGPYATRIFNHELGLGANCVINGIPLPDFNNGHPDPNLTYARELVEHVNELKIDLGAASDGDGDRNMIIGCDNAFVNPSDSVAIIAAWAQRAIPYFAAGLRGVARSMPTSRALDAVAEILNVPAYEVPTGWKYFGNLMDAGKICICGEESFGTGATHIREKDGIWAVLAWLSIMANAHKSGVVGCTVLEIMAQHFQKFGRHYFMRLDFEDVDAAAAKAYINNVKGMIAAARCDTQLTPDLIVKKAGSYSYEDLIDGSKAFDQGDFVDFKNDSRIVFRLSGTGSQGATIRIYVEKYDRVNYDGSPAVALADLISFAMEWTKIEKFTGRAKPTVIT